METFTILDIFIASLIVAQIPTGRSVESGILFTANHTTYYALEGETVELICNQDDTSFMSISREGIGIPDVFGALKTKYAPANFHFNATNVTGVLTITNITREDENTYTCQFPNTYLLIIDVKYRPSNSSPMCTSNYSPQIVQDGTQLQDEYQFNCTTDEGDPLVDISIVIHDKNGNRNITGDSELIIGHQTISRTLSYSFNHSIFLRSSFVCTVSQELPPPYEERNYTRSCSFIVVPPFTVSLSPLNPTTTKGDSVNFTCASSISDVRLEWTDVPDEWIQSNGTSAGYEFLELNFTYNGSKVDESFVINCTGSYWNISLSNSTTIYVTSETPDSGFAPIERIGLLIFSAVTGIVACIFFCVFIVCIIRKKKVKPVHHGYTPPVAANSSENNANDTSVAEEENEGNETNLDDLEDYKNKMVDNTAYWSYEERDHGTSKREHVDSTVGLEETNGMVDNVVYESTDRQMVAENTQESPYDVI